jgi:hypothetical protein
MGWRFFKAFNFGIFRATISNRGVGKSVGLLGFRFGINASGRKYWSFGVPNTGLYYIKYLN